MAASDKEFKSYIKPEKDECDQGKDTPEVQLMKLTLKKCVNKKRDCEWSALSEEEKRIPYLRGSLAEVKKESMCISKAL